MTIGIETQNGVIFDFPKKCVIAKKITPAPTREACVWAASNFKRVKISNEEVTLLKLGKYNPLKPRDAADRAIKLRVDG